MHHFIPQENEALLFSEAWLHYRPELLNSSLSRSLAERSPETISEANLALKEQTENSGSMGNMKPSSRF